VYSFAERASAALALEGPKQLLLLVLLLPTSSPKAAAGRHEFLSSCQGRQLLLPARLRP
jgi:hypothetical protein